MISSASSLQFHGSCCGVKFSFYTLCRRSTWIMHWAREISCFKSYMHLPRFCLYYQDELQMVKCLMGYGLTSLFSIQLGTAFASLGNMFWFFCVAYNFKKDQTKRVSIFKTQFQLSNNYIFFRCSLYGKTRMLQPFVIRR